jgi:hypothetical protein
MTQCAGGGDAHREQNLRLLGLAVAVPPASEHTCFAWEKNRTLPPQKFGQRPAPVILQFRINARGFPA